jgi:hypothetical protein
MSNPETRIIGSGSAATRLRSGAATSISLKHVDSRRVLHCFPVWADSSCFLDEFTNRSIFGYWACGHFLASLLTSWLAVRGKSPIKWYFLRIEGILIFSGRAVNCGIPSILKKYCWLSSRKVLLSYWQPKWFWYAGLRHRWIVFEWTLRIIFFRETIHDGASILLVFIRPYTISRLPSISAWSRDGQSSRFHRIWRELFWSSATVGEVAQVLRPHDWFWQFPYPTSKTWVYLNHPSIPNDLFISRNGTHPKIESRHDRRVGLLMSGWRIRIVSCDWILFPSALVVGRSCRKIVARGISEHSPGWSTVFLLLSRFGPSRPSARRVSRVVTCSSLTSLQTDRLVA